jgi:hypothetical protein
MVESQKVAEREGFEPFCRLEAKSLRNADLINSWCLRTGGKVQRSASK